MAAPTSVRVEANSMFTTYLRWDYPGANSIDVYRSTDGAIYSLVATVVSGILKYNDTGLASGTKYWYKLTEDLGVTYSAVVSVWTHNCEGPKADPSPLSLPRILDEEIEPGDINEMARRIEAALGTRNVQPDQCFACPADGALVIDCSDGCVNWIVIADADINSVAINWCDKFDGTIDFIIPPNTAVGICGFPAGFGFSGDECTDAPVAGGVDGRTMSLWYGAGGGAGGGGNALSSPGYGKKPGSPSQGEGGSGGGCSCVPGPNNQLTIVSCSGSNSLCSGGQELKLVACGGLGPYTWSHTGTVKFKAADGSPVDTVSHSSATVVPPENTGSAVIGTAYMIRNWECTSCVSNECAAIDSFYHEDFGCDDVSDGCFITAAHAPNHCSAPIPTAADMICHTSFGACLIQCDAGVGAECTGRYPTQCDARTALMIEAGCNPCSLAADGVTVSVTDAAGVSASIVLSA